VRAAIRMLGELIDEKSIGGVWLAGDVL